MYAPTTVANPFELMMNPQAVIAAMERSERLGQLERRVCRPLDRPLLPKTPGTEVAAFDSDVDAAPEAGAQVDDAAHAG